MISIYKYFLRKHDEFRYVFYIYSLDVTLYNEIVKCLIKNMKKKCYKILER